MSHFYFMVSDEDIRLLCARILKARGKEFDTAVAELQSAIEKRLTEQDSSDGDQR